MRGQNQRTTGALPKAVNRETAVPGSSLGRGSYVTVAALALSPPCGDLAHIGLKEQDLLPSPGGSTPMVPLRGADRNTRVRNPVRAYCPKKRKTSSSEDTDRYPPFQRKEEDPTK